MPTDQKIDYLELPAIDFDTVQEFYEKAFDWSFTDYGPEYRAFTDKKLDGGFYRSEARSTTENGAALIIIYSEELEQTKEHVWLAAAALSKTSSLSREAAGFTSPTLMEMSWRFGRISSVSKRRPTRAMESDA